MCYDGVSLDIFCQRCYCKDSQQKACLRGQLENPQGKSCTQPGARKLLPALGSGFRRRRARKHSFNLRLRTLLRETSAGCLSLTLHSVVLEPVSGIATHTTRHNTVLAMPTWRRHRLTPPSDEVPPTEVQQLLMLNNSADSLSVQKVPDLQRLTTAAIQEISRAT